MYSRHNYVAHSGITEEESVTIAAVLAPRYLKFVPPLICTELHQVSFHHNSKEDISFENLVTHLQQKTLSKMEELKDKIYQEMLEDGPNYWYSKAVID